MTEGEVIPTSEHDWRVDTILLGNGRVLSGHS
jgi:hypothetical protein